MILIMLNIENYTWVSISINLKSNLLSLQVFTALKNIRAINIICKTLNINRPLFALFLWSLLWLSNVSYDTYASIYNLNITTATDSIIKTWGIYSEIKFGQAVPESSKSL